MIFTRRDMGKLALAALPAARLLAKPNSRFGGVQVGINVPYSYGNNNMSADETLNNTVQLGLSAVELRTQPIESFLGSPAAGRGARGGRRGETLTPEQQAVQAALAGELRKWRLSRTTEQFRTFRKKYEDAGVAIQIVKVDGIDAMEDDVVDYCFVLARTVGAKAISCEIPLSRTKRLGAFADKHKMMVGYHGHTNITDPEAFGRPESWETAITYAKYNGINLDIGHFVAGNSISPVEFIKKYHDRITHIHVKDRKMHNGPNVPFGQGDTPIQEVLQLMRKEKWKFQATIEFEYPIPQGSTRMAEIAKCVEYCKNALA
ncbi:MAG: sugar phosphate isomerase/epimerase [Bryobacteraceae bacterium]